LAPHTVLFSLPAKLSVLHEGCAAGIGATLANVSQRVAQSATALVRAQSRTAQLAHSSQSHFRGRARNSVSLYRSLSKDSRCTSARSRHRRGIRPALRSVIVSPRARVTGCSQERRRASRAKAASERTRPGCDQVTINCAATIGPAPGSSSSRGASARTWVRISRPGTRGRGRSDAGRRAPGAGFS
jgi:hypothetical protein